MPNEHINPDSLFTPRNNNYTQIVTSTGGKTIHLAGMTPYDKDRKVVGEGDYPAQVRCVCEYVVTALAEVGASPTDIVRMNIFTTSVDDWLKYGSIELGKIWGALRPASTMVGVTQLSDPGFLVEIEVTAVVD